MQTGTLHEKDVPAVTAAACRSRPSSHALNAKPICPRLEDHRVWPVRLAETEAGTEVVGKVSLLLNGSEKRLVDLLLVFNAVLVSLLLLYNSQPSFFARNA
jgi:hypothetical protein